MNEAQTRFMITGSVPLIFRINLRISKQRRKIFLVFLSYSKDNSYLFLKRKNRLHLRKIQINLVFRSICTIFAEH